MTTPGAGDGQAALDWLAVEGGLLRVARAGVGSPIVLLHGWTLDHRVWAPQLALARQHRLVMPDRRGFGRSTAPPDLGREPDDLLRLLDDGGFGSAVVVAQSQAARVALRLSRRHPDRVSGLVLQGPALAGFEPPPEPDEAIPLERYRSWVRGGQLDEMKRRWGQHPLMRVERAEARATLATLLADYDGRDLNAAAAPLEEVEPGELGSIRTPTLVVTGARDTPWRQRVADSLAKAVPRGQRRVLEQAGHLCNLCQPDEFNAAIARFVDAVGEPTPRS